MGMELEQEEEYEIQVNELDDKWISIFCGYIVTLNIDMVLAE